MCVCVCYIYIIIIQKTVRMHGQNQARGSRQRAVQGGRGAQQVEYRTMEGKYQKIKEGWAGAEM
jgi:hypothetical protein